LTINQDRRLRALRAERLAIARRVGVAPARLITDDALIRLIESPPPTSPRWSRLAATTAGF